MPKVTIQQGDCLTSIALAQGFAPEQLWDHPENAALKQLRKSPNALLPGDQVEVPELEEREESAATGSFARFQLSSIKPAKLRVRMTRHGEPRADEPYELTFEDDTTLSGTTDSEGWIEQPLPTAAMRVTLSLRDGNERHILKLGHLDPHDSPSGMQQRLRALGYYFGALDEDLGPQTRAALRRFQAKQNLEVTGEADEATLDAVFEAYGS